MVSGVDMTLLPHSSFLVAGRSGQFLSVSHNGKITWMNVALL